MAGKPYNPLDKRNLGDSVAKALLERPVVRLTDLTNFKGAGIYAIYYSGSFAAYRSIVLPSPGQATKPIYVGKAVPAGARKGGFGLDTDPGTVLYGRLREHADSISVANNLDVADFFCRYLVTDDIWIPLAESVLIEVFRPVWNKLIDGFGNHDPGKGRLQQQRSPWDSLHPGRAWAARLRPNLKTQEQLLALVEDFFAGKEVPEISTEKAVTEGE
jgi:hypothetical protein